MKTRWTCCWWWTFEWGKDEDEDQVNLYSVSHLHLLADARIKREEAQTLESVGIHTEYVYTLYTESIRLLSQALESVGQGDDAGVIREELIPMLERATQLRQHLDAGSHAILTQNRLRARSTTPDLLAPPQ